MAKQFDHITPELQAFIQEQKIFFVGTAAPEGRLNISPKGMDTLRILDGNRLLWLNLTGSGNETAAHLLENNRMTILFCSFEQKPLILRLYGTAQVYHKRDAAFQTHISAFPPIAGARQIYEMQVDLVQTSCGYAVPLMDFQAERPVLQSWAEKQGEKRLATYHKEKNATSLDGKPTGM